MSESVYVAGGSMIPFGKHRASSYVGLALPPIVDALRTSGMSAKRVDAVYVGHAYGGMMAGQRILKEIGLGGVPVVNVDNACSGGATAVHEGWAAIRSGRCDVVLAVGVEKLTQFGGGTLPLSTEDREVQQGMVMPAVYAMRAQRYLHETEATVDDLASVSVKSRQHGSLNPYAQMRETVTVEEVLSSRPIAEPLTLMMCCPTGDGAAAVVLVSDRIRRELEVPVVRIAASVLHSGQVAEGYRDMTWPEITHDSARDAYEQSGMEPGDLDMVELHDAFSIAELVYYEALGLAERGRGYELVRRGATTFGGEVVVNPSGGLLSKGHPVGASGAAQIVEAYWQLTGRAGARQVPGARTALTHITGGGTAGLDHGACTVHIFEATG